VSNIMAQVLLFNPPALPGAGFTREGRCTQKADIWGTVWPPISLATAAALLEAEGHDVRLIDFSATTLNIEILPEIVRTMQPDFVIWPVSTTTMSSDLNIAGIVKENCLTAITCVFGTHVTVEPESALQNQFIDAVLRGEPEGIIRDMCRYTGEGWKSATGISYLDKATGLIRNNAKHDFLPPETIPHPAWHLLDLKKYRLPLKNRKFLIVAPLRGCPYRCSFCTASIYYGTKPRLRPVEKVIDEIAECISRYKIRDFFIWADTFTINSQYVRDFCAAIIDRQMDICWTCNSRVDTVEAQTLELMKRAGLWMISFGIEAGNNKILAATGKGITVEQSIKAVRMANDLGIQTAGHFMLGLPGETTKTMQETLALALSLPLDIAQFYAATPFPGTGLYYEAIRQGWLTKGTDMSQTESILELPGLSAKEVNAFRRYAMRKFYLRPRIAWSILSMIDPAAIVNSMF
jgi:anaerobic magnesium-protoporphyrin IX monomethyl ester cyclase